MSALYNAEIVNVAGAAVVIRVTSVHPDAGPPPTESTFPMNLLVDLWSLLDRGLCSQVTGIPRMTADEGRELAAQEPWGPLLAPLRDASHGIDLPATVEDLAALDAQRRARQVPLTFRGRRVGSFGRRFGKPHVLVVLQPSEVAAVMEPLVASYRQVNAENQDAYAGWPDGADLDDLPRVDLVLELHDPSPLGFLRPGMRWSTAVWF